MALARLSILVGKEAQVLRSWLWYLLERFFAQRIGGLWFARRGRNHAPALGFQLFCLRPHPSEYYFHVITTFARDFFSHAVNFSEDFVFFHSQVSIKSFGVQMMGQV